MQAPRPEARLLHPVSRSDASDSDALLIGVFGSRPGQDLLGQATVGRPHHLAESDDVSVLGCLILE